MYVHILVIREEHEKASVIDHVIQRSILLFYYPVLIIGLFCIGFNMVAAGAIVLIVATVSLCIGTYLLVGYTERQKVKGRLSALKAINTGATEPTKEALRTAFAYFDHNGNSEILVASSRELLHARLPGLSKDQMTQAMMKAREISGEQGSLDFSAFNDLLDWAVREFPPGTTTGTLVKKVGRAISVTRLTSSVVAPGDTSGQQYEVTSLGSPTSEPKPPE